MFSWLFSIVHSIVHTIVMNALSFILEPVKTVVIEGIFLY